MKKLRIGCGAGGCTYERMEPAIELIEKGNLDYLIFECLAERTIADAQKAKLSDPKKGYNPMLEERMQKVLGLAKQHGTKIVSNMGAANTAAAVEAILNIAREQKIAGLKVAMVTGDDILKELSRYQDAALWDRPGRLSDLEGVISANVYLSGDPIREALDAGADVVITGRVADPALFVGPIKHEFGWTAADRDKMGQAVLLGHLLECAGQLTGGFYADPGYKDVEDLHRLGFPIAEIGEDGDFIVTKVAGSGGAVNESICREQLLYEISDPASYITPDAIADFSHVTFRQMGKDAVLVQNATSHGLPETYKVNIGYQDCWRGFGELSYGGSNALRRAKLAADIIEKRWGITGVQLLERRIDYIGYNSLYQDRIAENYSCESPGEIRLRITVRAKEKQQVEQALREVQCMYTNGPAGTAGIFTNLGQVLSIENILVPKEAVHYQVTLREV